MRAGIAETDAPGVSRSKLAASVAEHVPDEEERRWLEPRLAFLLGLDERPTGGGDELFAAWRTFFERISDAGTVAMVFEDLQWADAGLLDFIESLLEWSRNRPIFIVTLARPELSERRPTWGAGTQKLLVPPPRAAAGRDDGRAGARDGARRRRHVRDSYRATCGGHAAVRRRDDPDARRPRCARGSATVPTSSSAISASSTCRRRCTH